MKPMKVKEFHGLHDDLKLTPVKKTTKNSVNDFAQ